MAALSVEPSLLREDRQRTRCRQSRGCMGAFTLLGLVWAAQSGFVGSAQSLRRVAARGATSEVDAAVGTARGIGGENKNAIAEWEKYIGDIRKDPTFAVPIFAGLTAISVITLLSFLPRLLASSMGVQGAAPIDELSKSASLNAGVTAFFAALAKFEFDKLAEISEVKKQRLLAEGLRGLPMQINGKPQKLWESGTERVLFCIGSAEFCRSCVDPARSSKALEDTNSVLVVMPLTVNLTLDRAVLSELYKTPYSSVGIPDLLEPSPAWDFLCEREFEEAKAQGISLDFVQSGRAPAGKYDGLSMMFGKDDRMKGRFMGEPVWDELSRVIPVE